MIRKIIHIDEEKCNGCGLCAKACHEGAIDMVDGKAKLVREHFCDGFGDCLPNCPMGAISFEEREAPAYDEAAVKKSQMEKQAMQNGRQYGQQNGQISAMERKGKMENRKSGSAMTMGTMHHEGGCPGSRFMKLDGANPGPLAPFAGQAAGNAVLQNSLQNANTASMPAEGTGAPLVAAKPVSRLGQWPCQIRLLPTQAPFYDGAKLLIAADCTAYAYANMHEDFMRGKITLIGCPKLDPVDYSEKLTAIIRDNDVKSVTIVRMEVPCCGGLQRAAETALRASGKFIPWQVVTISRDGRILD